jgi:septal ring factor EnvC (AmiA/AmiB activator)
MQDQIENHWSRIETLQKQLKNSETVDNTVLDEITKLQSETKEMMNTVFDANQKLEFLARQATLS